MLIWASHEAFSASGRKLATMELAANWRSSSRVNPCWVWARRNSLTRSEPKKAGSSELRGDEEAAIEILAQGVGGEGGADAGADVGGWVEFECGAARFQVLEKSLILNGG